MANGLPMEPLEVPHDQLKVDFFGILKSKEVMLSGIIWLGLKLVLRLKILILMDVELKFSV